MLNSKNLIYRFLVSLNFVNGYYFIEIFNFQNFLYPFNCNLQSEEYINIFLNWGVWKIIILQV